VIRTARYHTPRLTTTRHTFAIGVCPRFLDLCGFFSNDFLDLATLLKLLTRVPTFSSCAHFPSALATRAFLCLSPVPFNYEVAAETAFHTLGDRSMLHAELHIVTRNGIRHRDRRNLDTHRRDYRCWPTLDCSTIDFAFGLRHAFFLRTPTPLLGNDTNTFTENTHGLTDDSTLRP